MLTVTGGRFGEPSLSERTTMNKVDTTGRRLALPRARFEGPEPWKDTDQKQLLQFLKTPSGTKFLLTLHALVTNRCCVTACLD